MAINRIVLTIALAAGVGTTTATLAAVSADEARQLGNSLTEFGAEKSGNADGSIPAYTGGIETVAGYDPKTSAQYVDPFKDEKPLYSVTAENMAQYDDLLAPGAKALLKTYPGFRIDVYPSHRSFRYAPWVLQNTLKNATTAKMTGQIEGDTLEGADKGNLPYAGIPFPIPKNGYEVMWNNALRFSAALSHTYNVAWLVDSTGNQTKLPSTDSYFMHPWYDAKGVLRGQSFDAVYSLKTTIMAPPSAAGIVFLNFYTANAEIGQKGWFYTPGQRRIRPAPEFSYDLPFSSYVSTFWDEISGFVGRMDRFDFKLAGKKEMLVPYNVFGVTNTFLDEDFLGKKFINPDAVRWEKHRVWVVDSIRKPAAHHAFSRRTFYIDEDCWCITQYEAYDDANNLWHVSHVNNFPSYDTGGINVDSWTVYDLVKGNYAIYNVGHKEPGNFIRHYDTAEGLSIGLSAQSIAQSSSR